MLIDAYPYYDKDTIVLWLWNERGPTESRTRISRRHSSSAPRYRRPDVRKRLEILDQMEEVREVDRHVDIGSEEAVPVLEIVPRHYRELQDIAKIVGSNGGYHDYALYNVDLRFGQRYCLAHKIFPCGLLPWYNNGRWRAEEEQFALD